MYIGSIDIGGSKSIAAVLDENLEILAKRVMKGHIKDHGEHFDAVCAMLGECADELGIKISDLSGLGVIPPGMVVDDVLLLAPATGWRNVDMVEEFKARTGLDVIGTDGDINACAIGERYFGGEDDFLWMNVSNGIGGAIIMNGEIFPGATGVSGEIGHIKVEYDRPKPCPCGQRGCAEAHASGAAIGRTVKALADADGEYLALFQEKGYPIDAYRCSLLAREGEERSLGIMEEAATYIGRALAAGINTLNPAKVYMGGGVSLSLDLLLPTIRRTLDECCVEFARNIPIKRTRLGYYAALKGSATLALRKLKDRG